MTNPQIEVDDAVVLLLGSTPVGKRGMIRGITRLEKLIFLLERETSASTWLDESADFKPYNFGPFSEKVYQAVDLLSAAGLVIDSADASSTDEDAWEQENVIGTPWSDFKQDSQPQYTTRDFELTSLGWDYYQALSNELGRSKVDELASFLKKYSSLPLRQLVRYVYTKYGEYAEKSLIRDDILGA